MRVSNNEQFALYERTIGHTIFGDINKTTSRTDIVVSVPHCETIMAIPLPVKQSVVSTFGTIGNQDYLLLLRDGIKLEVYPLP